MNYSELSDQVLDDAIDQAHAALARAEADALQVQQRIARIDGLSNYASRRRRYGELPNPWADGSLTAQALIQREDPALASFLAARAGRQLPAPDYAAQERNERRSRSAAAMAEATQQLRARNEAQRNTQERQRIYGGGPNNLMVRPATRRQWSAWSAR